MEKALRSVFEWCQRWRWPVVVGFVLVAAGGGWYTLTYLGLDADLAHMISDDLPFHKRWLEYREAFPHLSETFVVVVEGPTPAVTVQVATELAEQIAQRRDDFASVSVFQDEARPLRQFVETKPVLDFSEILPQAKPMQALQDLRRQFEDQHVSLRITGPAALAYQEMQSVSLSAGWAGVFSLILVGFILILTMRSWRLVTVSMLTLLVGLILTATFAALAVGHLSMISVAFAAMFIGLGIDYAIHLSLRYRDLVNQGQATHQALAAAGGQVGSSLVICTLTTAGGFFAFVPTSYAGVSELGLISGVGMILNLLTYMTLYPALLALMPVEKKVSPGQVGRSLLDPVFAWPYRHARAIRWAAPVVVGLGVAGAVQLQFNPNPLDLQDPNTEAYQTYRELLADPAYSPWTIKILEDDAGKVRDLVSALERLPEVGRVLSLEKLLPVDVQERLQAMGDADPAAQRLRSEILARIPQIVRDRFVTNGGLQRIEVFPAFEIHAIGEMRRFADAVLRLAPNATGDPVTLPATGDAVVEAFQKAALWAFAICLLLVFFVMRRPRDVALVFLPVLAGGLTTAGLIWSLGYTMNFASIIVVPLLLGMGIDYGVHFVYQGRDKPVLWTSTPRAVMASAFTTIVSFGTLSFATHRGLASLGVVLALGMLLMMLAALWLIPACQEKAVLGQALPGRESR